ncbi:hypothetical protein OPIT5_30710 [Opitutaceae bacterium TAV5]|nr:hypothetical protein OPIT5_30710 [Opitutaceae bacterium TAV5]
MSLEQAAHQSPFFAKLDTPLRVQFHSGAVNANTTGAPPPLPSPAGPSCFRRHHRLTALVLTFLVLKALLAGLYLRQARDEPPPDLTEIEIPRPPKIPDEQNAYSLLAQAAAAAQTPLLQTRKNDIHALATGTLRDDALHAELLAHAEACNLWPQVAAALAAPDAQGPWPTKLDSFIPEIGQVRFLAQYMIIRAIGEARRGDTHQAVQTLRDVFAVGTIIENSSTSLIHYLTGLAIKTVALDATRRLAVTQPLSGEDLRFAIATVRASRINPENTRRTFRLELNFFRLCLDEVLRDRKGLYKLSPETGGPQGAHRRLAVMGKLRLTLKPNKTTRLYTENLREVIQLIGKDSTAITSSGIANSLRYPRLPNPENFVGKILLAIVTPTWPKILQSGVRHETAFSGTEAFLALRLYALEHDNTLPATLDALVPDYLSAVPRDHADGKPIRYSREFHALWSVGENNLDVTRAGQKPEKRDLILDLVFAAPAAPADQEPAPLHP